MAKQSPYVTLPESDYSQGIDARSAENQIEPGFLRDLLNADVIGKRVRKRVGNQGYAGNLPVRVTSLEYSSTGTVSLTLDSAVSLSDTTVDLTATRSSPLVIHGRSSNIPTGGPFTTAGDSSSYYPFFLVPTRKNFLATAGAPPYETLTVSADEHGIPTYQMFTQVVEASSLTDRSYVTALPHSTELGTAVPDINISYQNSTGSTRPVYVYYKDRTPAAGQSYIQTYVHGGTGSETVVIPAGTHGLDNYNIIVRVQQDVGSSTVQEVQAVVVLSNAGAISVTLDSIVASTFYIMLSATPVTQSAIGNVQAGTTSNILLTGLGSPWIFYAVYQELTPGGSKELVFADSVSYDDDSQTATISFTNSGGSAANFFVFYDYGIIRSNRIQVQDVGATVDAIDTRPQLTIWGLDHAEIYGPTPSGRSGWVNELDSYKSSSDRRLVAGLGGNLFTARTYDEASSEYLMPLLYPRLQARVLRSVVLGPLFYDTSDTPGRTRGYITSSESGTGWARATSISYSSSTGFTTVVLSLPDLAILDANGGPAPITQVIGLTPGLEDYLTLQNMSYSRHNGTFRLVDAEEGVDSITFTLDLPGNSSDYNDTGTSGDAGVFTDQIEWIGNSPFVAGDILVNAALGDTQIYTVSSSLGNATIFFGAYERLDIAGGLVTAGRRRSSLIPLRGPLPTSTVSVAGLVRGDMLVYTGEDYLTGADQVERLLRVESIIADIDRPVNITPEPELGTALVTMTTGDTTYLTQGARILILQAGPHSGNRVIEELLSLTEFRISLVSPTAPEFLGAVLVGGVVELDEILEWEDAPGDSISMYPERRWIPVEAPDDNYDLTPSTYVRHMDGLPYGDQDPLRSTMVADGLYLTNGTDEVMKFDSSTLYRAGLPAWQPGLYLTQDTEASARIVISTRSVSYTAGTAGAPAGRVKLAGALDSGAIPVGAQIKLSGSTQTYTVREYTDNATDYYLLLDRSLDSSVGDTGTASEIATYRYYFRLNAVDANDNIVSSAVTGYQDHVVELTESASVQLKLVGMPVLGIYDYDRLELEIYRTRQSTPAPFYRITTLPLDFDNTQGYIVYTDTFADSDLIELDQVSTALKGTELGIQWQEPLRARYISSIGNKLVLANVKDYPQIDMQIIASGAVTSSTYSGKIFTLRRDNTATGLTTDMVTTARYETVAAPTGTVSAPSVASGILSFTTSAPTGAVEGDWIYLSYTTVSDTDRDLTYSGHYQISSVTGTTVEVAILGGAAATTYPDSYTVATDPTDIPVLLGTDGNLGMVNGDSFDLFDLTRRMALAVNSSMRMVDTSLTGMSEFVPWIVARSGNDVSKSGRIVLRRPYSDLVTPELTLPASFEGAGQSFQVFVNDIRRTPSSQVSAVTRLYPSRVLVSYENYPEIFDNPTSILASESDSAVDINPADGQVITGVIPFFGESAFGAAQQSAILVVFKSNSVYLVDLNEKAAGRDPVQRIETEGLGCTAPYSIASTRGGIMFANESGIYCLRRDQSIQYIGKYMERNWTEKVNLDLLSLAQGHHYGVGRSYKLSVPLVGEEANSQVYVYNHTGEVIGSSVSAAKEGAWSRYDNHNATGWANLDTEAFWSSTQGRVLSLRNTGTRTDYRDSSEAIRFLLDTRAISGGDEGIRKILDALVVYYRILDSETGTSVSFSIDTSQEFLSTSRFTLRKPGTSDGISDTPGSDIIGILHNTSRRRGTHFQIRIENSSLDENLEITGISLRIAGLNERGIKQAAKT